jgi:chloramphenicol-sensitive protein RarD
MNQTHRGYWSAIGCYAIWGVMPIYMRWLQALPPIQIVAHRIIWSCLILFILLGLKKSFRPLITAVLTPKLLGIYTISALCVSSNWMLYVWGVNNGFMVETSLGYFINPLVSVLLGVLVLGERLHRLQTVAVIVAVFGVVYVGFSYSSVPWLAIAVAITFGLYGLIRKMGPLGASHGLTLETLILLPVAFAYLFLMENDHGGSFLRHGWRMELMLVGAGLFTTVPLLLFNSAAQKISLIFLGIFQYISPSMQFLLGVFLYHEPVNQNNLIGFMLVWCGLLIFAFDSLQRYRKNRHQII